MKPTKLNLSSTNEEIISTILQEGKSVEYYHKKYYGGKHKYDKWQDEQLEMVQSLPEGSELLGDMVDYHSLTTGNRWKSFEVTSCYGVGNAYTRAFKFCYWDTYGSVGAFYRCVTTKGMSHVLVFPSHFFERYAERMEIGHRDAALVCEFFNRNHAFAITLSEEPDEKGRRKLILGAKEGVCYGFTRTNIESPEDLETRNNVFEVRTFLKYEQLTKKQQEECQIAREGAERGRLTDGAPLVHSATRAITDKDYAKKLEDIRAKDIGISPKQLKDLNKLLIGIVNVCDFVSGDLRKSLHSIAKGDVSSKEAVEVYNLSDIIAEHIRKDKDFVGKCGLDGMLEITHEWKGDNYDWNKWFWSLLSKIQNSKELEPLKMQCVQGQFTYAQIKTILKTMYT